VTTGVLDVTRFREAGAAFPRLTNNNKNVMNITIFLFPLFYRKPRQKASRKFSES
jgi:hypothetical protein